MNIIGKLEYWQDEWMPSFKYSCYSLWIKPWFEIPYIPEGAKFILFHDMPNPRESITGNSEIWYLHIQPSPWIEGY